MYNFFEPEKAMSEEEIIDILTPDDSYKQTYKQEQKVPEKVEKKPLTWLEIYDNAIEVLIQEGKIKDPKKKNKGWGKDEETPAKSAKCTI